MPVLQPLTTGQLLDRIFQLYRQRFLLFFGISVVPPAIIALAMLLIGGGAAMGVVGVAIAGLISIILYLGAIGASQGATTLAVSDVYLERPVSVATAYRRILPKSFRLLLIIIGYGVATAVGFVLLIVPGIYVLLTYALALTSSTLENLGFSRAMQRSAELAKGQRGRLFIIFLLSFVAAYACQLGLAIPAQLLAERLMESAPILATVLNLLGQLLGGALAAPISLIGFTLAYYDARVRKEAFDLHLLMDSEAAAAAAGPVAS